MSVFSTTFDWSAATDEPCTRRRRPTGAPAPLPRHLGASGGLWLAATATTAAWVALIATTGWARSTTERVDDAVLRAFAAQRTDWLVGAARAIDRAATGWPLSVVAFGLLAAAVACRRWRHLFAFVGSVLVTAVIGRVLINGFQRPRPTAVDVVGRWRGYAFPSATVGIVAVIVIGLIYVLVPPGRPRAVAKVAGAGVVTAVAGARLLLGVDHPSDVLVAATIGVTVPLLAFRWFTPNEVVPVRYRRGRTAHLDVGGRRGEAIRRAVAAQLGLDVVAVEPFGLAGSGGSTPLRLRLAGDGPAAVFGKVYAMSHVRADRWYKLARTILYGRLEDERPFDSVRRLVQHEDHALRLMRDAGIPTAAPLGIVELTPEREYLLVTEFLDGATELGDAVVDDTIIDEGLAIVRRLWDAGLAHRDVKPANLLVRHGHLAVIDVAFAQVRPSPWRQAVDLANMMLVLAVRTDADRVYGRALAHFSPDEIAEAFAAAHGIASPTQLRRALEDDGRDLVARFRALAPPRRPIRLQRWGWRRVGLAAAALVVAVACGSGVYGMFTPVDLPLAGQPLCGSRDVLVLAAQAVPTAAEVPCLSNVPAGWDVADARVRRGEARFRLVGRGLGTVAVRVRSPERCRAEDGAAVVAGACTSWTFDVADPAALGAVRAAWSAVPREALLPG
jgi:tRNA A-37 threonylcarbamoyl transferase component Bud32